MLDILVNGGFRAFSHQFVRHRAGFSFSQLSQQYHDEVSASFVLPDEIEHDQHLKDSWLKLMQELRRGYNSIQADLAKTADENTFVHIRRAQKRHDARSDLRHAPVLPNATETKIVFSANGRALRHFLRVRGSIAGDLEMRKICGLIYSRLVEEAPSLFLDYKLSLDSNGYPIVEWFGKNR